MRKIVRGGVDESYGIEVAKLAGLPKKLIDRAKAVLSTLETKEVKPTTQSFDDQITFDRISENTAVERLRKTNIDELSDTELRELISDILRYI